MKRRWLIVAGVLIVLIAAGVVILLSTLRYGFSAHDEPTRIEVILARTMRHWAAPAELRDRSNPIPLTPSVLEEARAHFADHCATCHGNDGKGRAGMGMAMYPKTPDLTREETQLLSDGELFSIIENGVRLTGMPGFGDGTASSAAGSWTLVHFIRHLPKITPEETAAMKKLNPKSPEEWQEMQQEESFLAGGEETATTSSAEESQPHPHH